MKAIIYYFLGVYLLADKQHLEQYLVLCRYSINSYCLNDLNCLGPNVPVQTCDRRGQKRAAGTEELVLQGLSNLRRLTRSQAMDGTSVNWSTGEQGG